MNEKLSTQRTPFAWKLIIGIMIIGAIVSVWIFWWEAKQFQSKATSHIKNMKALTVEAKELQKKINRRLSDQRSILDNLE